MQTLSPNAARRRKYVDLTSDQHQGAWREDRNVIIPRWIIIEVETQSLEWAAEMFTGTLFVALVMAHKVLRTVRHVAAHTVRE